MVLDDEDGSGSTAVCLPLVHIAASPFERCRPSCLPFGRIPTAEKMQPPSLEQLDVLTNSTLDTCVSTAKTLTALAGAPSTSHVIGTPHAAAVDLVSGCIYSLVHFPGRQAKEKMHIWQKALSRGCTHGIWEAAKTAAIKQYQFDGCQHDDIKTAGQAAPRKVRSLHDEPHD